MRQFNTREHDLSTLRSVFDARLDTAAHAAEEAVKSVLAEVRARGDAAVLKFTRRWDWPGADSLRVSDQEIEEAVERVRGTELWPVLEQSAARIRRFHEKHLRTSWIDSSSAGEMLGQIVRPLGRVGVYVPGGTAAYPSTVLMAAVPAVVAGVRSVIVATPPGKDGRVPDATLAAARIAGAHEVYRIGGAQAIAAMAYGTESVARVDKIVGPGNIFVNLAKKHVYGSVGIDMLAGPSEVLVLADDTADPAGAAADILAQTEHDPNCSAIVVTPSDRFADSIVREIERQTAETPRGDIVRKALDANGFVVRTRDLAEAAAVASLYAPEHLHLDVQEPFALLDSIENAGAILIGGSTSAPIGDYMAGPSHTLPTAGCARFSSPLNVDDFIKKTSLLYFSEAAAAPLAESAATFADFEGLPAHAQAARRVRPGK